jgi:Domain of unknown function (DUF4440)/Domain of unknown function (DUF3471)
MDTNAMIKRISRMGLAIGLILAVVGCAHRKYASITEEELVHRTQELMDALAPGNPEPWKKYFADDAIYFDEKGRALDKAAIVKDVSPMPGGYSGAIKVLNPKCRIVGNTAILSYDLDETETIFGQVEHARYHGTDTWIRRNGNWQIVAGQMLRYYEDPAPGTMDVAKIKQYLGTYELAPGTTRAVTTDGQTLFMQRTGREKEALIPEAENIFFRRGVEGRILFRRHADGQPNVLIDRRNNEDVVWKRVS